MPGPISDNYDPEWGTGENAGKIKEELWKVYKELSKILNHRNPKYILDLVNEDLPNKIVADLTEKQWRMLRFAVERAMDSI